MSYLRDVWYNQNGTLVGNEQIPLPIEIVYNSYRDDIADIDPVSYEKIYYHNGPLYLNRLYFKYPPEWKTYNVGEKIIGIRNMKTFEKNKKKRN